MGAILEQCLDRETTWPPHVSLLELHGGGKGVCTLQQIETDGTGHSVGGILSDLVSCFFTFSVPVKTGTLPLVLLGDAAGD